MFWVNVPFGVFGTIWAYAKLRDTGVRIKAKLDWWGNITFGVGLVLILIGITYGIQPHGGHSMGWTSPWVLAELIVRRIARRLFCVIETRVAEPMFNLSCSGSGPSPWATSPACSRRSAAAACSSC